mmetsp:Transcript_10694/g.21490  ORF Transcript_10694/g.21490 Transcript_10694/m.21490 type:complete len:237 (-) Transcript_10694:1159-1869(-)
MYPQFPLRPSPPRAAISTPNFREDGRCCATRPRRGETSGVSVSVSVLVHGLSLSLSLSLARGVVVMAVVVFFVSICFLGMPSNSLPHTRAVNEKPTSMGQDIHKRSLSEALLKVLAAQERSFFSRCCRCDDDDDDDDDLLLAVFVLVLRNFSGNTQVRKGTAIPVRLEDSNSLIASLTVSLVASPLPLPEEPLRTAMCPSKIPRLTSTMTRPPLLSGRTAFEDQPPPLRMGKKESA